MRSINWKDFAMVVSATRNRLNHQRWLDNQAETMMAENTLGDGAGFVVLSTGAERRPLLWNCLASIERHYPGTPVHVVTDAPVDVPFTWVRDHHGTASRQYKTRLYDVSPFDVTVVIDDDTVIHKNFGTAEGVLRGGVIGMCPDHSFSSLKDYADRGQGGAAFEAAREAITAAGDFWQTQPYFSSGVIVFKRAVCIRELFEAWHDAWLVHQDRDQQPLIQAIIRSAIDVVPLPRWMNFVPEVHGRGHGFQDMPANILHFWKQKLPHMKDYLRTMGIPEAPQPKRGAMFDRLAATSQQCSPDQYRAIGSVINHLAPCKVLVFGAGRDSVLWEELNPGGRTCFVEDNRAWFEQAKAKGLEVLGFGFDSKRGHWVDKSEALPDVLQDSWDVIVIDGPAGNHHTTPGREIPARWVNTLRMDGDAKVVFMHDWQRPWEQAVADRYFGEPDRVIAGTDGRGDLAVWLDDVHEDERRLRGVMAGKMVRPHRSESSQKV